MATCVRITRQDNTAFHRTVTHDQSLDIDLADGQGVNTYTSNFTLNSSAINSDDTMSVDDLEVEGVVSLSGFNPDDLRRGLFDFATFEIFDTNWKDLSQGVIKHRRGTFGKVTVASDGRFNVELRGMLQFLTRTIVEAYSPECRADLGDERCKIPIFPDVVLRNTAYVVGDFVRASNDPSPVDSFDFDDRVYRCSVAGTTAGTQPTYDTVVGNSTVDGTATFVAEEAWSRAIEVSDLGSNIRKDFEVTELTPNSGGVTSGRDFFPDDSMNGGVVTFETGNNAGVSREVRDFVADDGITITQDLELFLPMPFDIQIGDRGRVYRGCFHRFTEDCVGIFANGDNFRGEPFVPTKDKVAVFPDVKR